MQEDEAGVWISVVIIDYLQLMSGSKKGGGDNRQQEISDISRSLKALPGNFMPLLLPCHSCPCL